MEQNPYQAPLADQGAVGVRSGRREDVFQVAKLQRSLLVCILLNFVMLAVNAGVRDDVKLITSLIWAVISVAGTVFVFMLAMKVYSTGAGVALGILSLLPCIGLIVLLVVNNKATKILQSNGYKVGLLGANPSQFR